MHRRYLIAGLLALAVAPATAAAELRTVTVDPATPEQSWEGTSSPGANMTFFEGDITKLSECGDTPDVYCDDTLVHFTSPFAVEESDLRFRIEGFDTSDYDMRIYTSDETGAEGEFIDTGNGDGTGVAGDLLPTWLGDPESLTTFAEPDSWYLMRVVYFTVPGHETYTGKVSWTGTELIDEGEGEPEGS